MNNTANQSGALLDLRFKVEGLSIPVDYMEALSLAVHAALPWFKDEPLGSLHPLGGLSPGEGCWYLSGRSRLTLRIPRARLDEARRLTGSCLRIGADMLKAGPASVRDLKPMTVIYSGFVTFGPEAGGEPIGEDVFLEHCRREFAAQGMSPRLICGKAQRAQTRDGLLSGFSLMVYGLDAAANLHLLQHGLGREHKRGCGVFVPHKSMTAAESIE